MQYNKVLRTLACALILSLTLLLIAIPATPAPAALMGSISLSPYSGPVGTSVTVNGLGFTPDSAYTVTFSTTTVATGYCDGTGVFIATFSVPTKARGTVCCYGNNERR